MVEEKRENKERWAFVHSIIKNVLMTSYTAVRYAATRLDSNPLRDLKEDFKHPALLKSYLPIRKAIDDWGSSRNTGRTDQMKGIVSLLYSVADEDWVYESLLGKVYVEVGKSYARNELGVDVDKKVTCLKRRVTDLVQDKNEELGVCVDAKD